MDLNSLHLLLAQLIKWEIFLLLGGLGGVIAIRLLTGRINTSYLLWGRRKDQTRYYSAERVQLLLATIAVAAQYVLTAAHSKAGEMPKLPDGTLQVLGLSNAIYLGRKGWTKLH
jgi:hypothetical protein